MSNQQRKFKSSLFLRGTQEEVLTVDEGVERQILGFDDTIMMVRASFEENAVGYIHAHPHSQVVYVESGVFDFTIGEETQRLHAGDGTYIPPDVDHGAVCIEKGMLLDVFSPMRKDFLPEK